MTPVALDGTQLIILMAAGGVFALAGLWLIFRPPGESGEAAKIEVLGLKFQSSSAGLLVFLIGAVFLAVPVFVPERPAPPSAVSGATPRADHVGVARRNPPENPVTATAIVLPAGASAAEQEPNDFVTEANQIGRGHFYSGQLNPKSEDFEDWFVSPTDGSDLQFQLRNRSDDALCYLTLLNDAEEKIQGFDFPSEGSSRNETMFIGDANHVFFRVHSYNNRYTCEYEFKVR